MVICIHAYIFNNSKIIYNLNVSQGQELDVIHFYTLKVLHSARYVTVVKKNACGINYWTRGECMKIHMERILKKKFFLSWFLI